VCLKTPDTTSRYASDVFYGKVGAFPIYNNIDQLHHHSYDSALHPSWFAKLVSALIGCGKGGNFTSARWQVTLSDPT